MLAKHIPIPNSTDANAVIPSPIAANIGVLSGRVICFTVMATNNQQQENDVLRKMLNTPHIPHKSVKESSPKPKRKPKA